MDGLSKASLEMLKIESVTYSTITQRYNIGHTIWKGIKSVISFDNDSMANLYPLKS